MNLGVLNTQVNLNVKRPQKISNQGNLYRMQLSHSDGSGNNVRDYEVWATKEAVQKHFQDMSTGEPKEYQLKKFARQMYEKRMRSSRGLMPEKGLLATSDDITHGNPALWPSTLSHPEVKI